MGTATVGCRELKLNKSLKRGRRNEDTKDVDRLDISFDSTGMIYWGCMSTMNKLKTCVGCFGLTTRAAG